MGHQAGWASCHRAAAQMDSKASDILVKTAGPVEACHHRTVGLDNALEDRRTTNSFHLFAAESVDKEDLNKLAPFFIAGLLSFRRCKCLSLEPW